MRSSPQPFIGQNAPRAGSGAIMVLRPPAADLAAPNNAPAQVETAARPGLSFFERNKDALFVGILSSTVAAWLAIKLFSRR